MLQPCSAVTGHRHSARAKINGSAIVHATGAVVRCTIDNISLGGALLRPTADLHSNLVGGDEVTIDLELVGGAASWVRQRGHVQRSSGPDQPFAVAFDDVSPDVEDLIEDDVLAALEAERAPLVLVVDSSRSSRRCLMSTLERQGFQPLGASTPLEAIHLLEGSRTPFAAVAIARSMLDAKGLLAFLADTRPGLRVALITHGRCTAAVDRDGRVVLQDVQGNAFSRQARSTPRVGALPDNGTGSGVLPVDAGAAA